MLFIAFSSILLHHELETPAKEYSLGIILIMSLKQFALGASGIYFAFCLSGVFSEKLYSYEYPSVSSPGHSSRYTFPDLTVWLSSLFCAFYGMIKSRIDKEPKNPIPIKEQILLGVLYGINMVCSASSLLYISFLDQAIGRSCRYLTVVIVGVYFSRLKKNSEVKLPAQKIITALVITIGVLSFSIFGDNANKPSHVDADNEWKGFLLLAISVITDAVFSDSQAYSKANFKPTSNQLFKTVNFMNFLFVLLLSIVRGSGLEQIYFCIDHPEAIPDILAIAAFQVLGQVSIYYIVLKFKQNIFPLISSTRRVFTVLLSIVIFGHVLNLIQWLSILLVYIGLGYELSEELSSKKAKPITDPKDVNDDKKIEKKE